MPHNVLRFLNIIVVDTLCVIMYNVITKEKEREVHKKWTSRK